ncbi:response regulator transcription factor [Phytohabitans flavus]|uniref:DNA-binding response regulator n=1 Tax=Phytohabitans flavus TaxID=1076124 RepID=A0A6F8XMW5_9ACTN|nr:response regulator transcription factor [Phytohabitans flavus]BCB75139.1 DNA-binding response regulator [Phytohabitans flavus]
MRSVTIRSHKREEVAAFARVAADGTREHGGRMMLRILICDRLQVVRNGLRALLEPEPDIEVVDTTESGPHAITLARTARPDVIVTGLDLADLSGAELIRQLARLERGPVPRMIVYSMADTDDAVSEALRAGASGVLTSTTGRQELAYAIRTVASGEAMLAPAVARRLVDWFRRRDTPPEAPLDEIVETLTPREREVLLLLAQGMRPQDIAGKLFIGVTTVRTHIYRLRGKLDLEDRAQLVSFAYRAGLMRSA